MWISGWLLTKRGHLRWIDDWIIQWRRHRYQRRWKIISLWVTVFAIKSPVITRVFCEDLDDCWQTEDNWDGLMTELLNGEGTDINDDKKLLLFEWLYLRFKHRLSWGVVRCLLWFFPVPLLWRLPILFGRGMMNAIWVLVVLCACYFVCWCPSKGERQIFGTTTAVIFDFQYQE